MTSIVAAPRAPYSLEPTMFSFPALATMAGRAPLGGPRELALACFVVGRVVRDAQVAVLAFSEEQLEHRHAGAKHWLGSAALQPTVRMALSRLLDASATRETVAVQAALEAVMMVTANNLDPAARLELGHLAQAIAG